MPPLFQILFSRFSTIFFITLSGFVLMSCASFSQESDEAKMRRHTNKSARVTTRGDAIIFNGPLNKANNRKLFEAFDGTAKSPNTLRITSGGGSVEAGLEMGEWILENQLNVHIPELCGSSCANYIFTAGKEVTLGKTAILFWHGSPTIDDLVAGTPDEKERWDGVINSLEQTNPELTNPREYWNKIRDRNRRFFQTVGIHPIITLPSIVADESSRARIKQAGSWTQYGAYMSLEDMKFFGVNNVRVEGDKTWTPQKSRRFQDAYIKVTLIEDVEQKLANLNEQLKGIK